MQKKKKIRLCSNHQIILAISRLEMVIIHCGENVPFIHKKLQACPTTQRHKDICLVIITFMNY